MVCRLTSRLPYAVRSHHEIAALISPCHYHPHTPMARKKRPCACLKSEISSTRGIFLFVLFFAVLLSLVSLQRVYDAVVPPSGGTRDKWQEMIGVLLANGATNNISSPSPSIEVPCSSLSTRFPHWQSNLTRQVLFVHVGKAGGETIKSILAAGCNSKRNKRNREVCQKTLPNSSLSDAVKKYTHTSGIGPQAAQLSTSYLYNIRHPVDRVESWYNYVSPKNCNENDRLSPSCKTARNIDKDRKAWESLFFDRCFPSVEEWAQTLMLPLRKTFTNSSSYSCPELAWSALRGQLDTNKNEVAAHMVCNFDYYTNITTVRFPEKEILVVRTNHMWEDLVNLDRLLGGNGTFGDMHGSQVTHGSHTHAHKRPLSDSGYKLLCCGLEGELKIHNYLLRRATNLDENSKADSQLETLAKCGVSSWAELRNDCASLIPSMAVR